LSASEFGSAPVVWLISVYEKRTKIINRIFTFKKIIMKNQHVHQEVLIFTNTTLSQEALCRKSSSNKNNSAIEELEEAFWDGLLNELVPEIMPSTRNKMMVIQGVYVGEFYFLIDLADNPGIAEPIFSINPDLLSSLINMN
jgi:hypothetical protein